MVQSCSAFGCKTRYEKHMNVKFHKLVSIILYIISSSHLILSIINNYVNGLYIVI